ncbi:MAG: TonB-dependent receptor [Bacteroidales bacterium]|nr:TonB-dependent receptor [Bacteroidales bacterium]
MKSRVGAILALFVGLLISLPAGAQTTTSSIVGSVSDANGPLADAIVTAVYVPTGMQYHGITNAMGRYRINGVVAGGPYTVRAELMGYRTVVMSDVTAPLGDRVELEFELKMTSTALDEIVVVDQATHSNMNVQNSGASTNISNAVLMATPTASRSLYDVMRLTPQSISTPNGFMVGGGDYRGSSVTVDGASFNNAFGIGSSLPAGGNPLSLDAIDQISVSITPFDVRHSGFKGGAINMVTKQGGNEWHASLYDYYNSSWLRGRRLGDVALPQSNTLNNVAGFTLSGPIVKDKLFFFLNAEYTPEKVPGASAQARADSNAAWGGNGYNRPTVDRMDSIRNYLMNEYGYDPGRYQNYSVDASDYRVLARLDWIVNSNNRFNVRFSHTHTTTVDASNSMSTIGGTNTAFLVNGERFSFNRYSEGRLSDYSMMFESARFYKNQDFTSVAAELDSRLWGGKGNNNLRVTWSYQNEPRSHYGDLFPTVDILEPYTAADGSRKYASYTTFGLDPFTYMTANSVSTFNVTDELTYSSGIHNVLAGVQFEHSNIRNVYMPGGAGWYVFDSWDSFVNKRDPVLFMVAFANQENRMALPEYVFNYLQPSLYAQDEMEFSRYFKLTAGLRLEVPVIRFANDNYHAGFAQFVADHPGSTFEGLNPGDMPRLQVNVSPRVGFNWDVTRNRKVVLRGGTGLFTGRIPNVWFVNAISNSNVMLYQYVANTQTQNPVVPFSPSREEIVNSVPGGGSMALPSSPVILDKNLKMPTSWKSSLAVDVKLPWGVKGTVEGILSYNYNEVVSTTLGYVPADSLHLPGEPRGRVAYQQESVANGMSGYRLHNVDGLHGRYLSVVAQLEKHFGFGLDVMAAYTYSSSLSVSDGGGDAVYTLSQTSTVDGDNSPELGFTAYVAPHRLIASANYTLFEGRRTATRLGLFYEGYNIGMMNGNGYARCSYLMNNVGGINASRLLYVPTEKELEGMPFSSVENRADYGEFIANDAYLSRHRGEYALRGALLTPWHNRLDLKVCQEFYFDVNGRRTTLEVGADINNVANLLNSEWGTYKQLASQTVLEYKNGVYTFSKPKWNVYSDLLSAWQVLLHVRYSF